jgi:hypothetical protein
MQMTDAQVLTVVLATVPTFVVVILGLFLNNSRLNDLKDLLRAEMAKNQAELLLKLAQVHSPAQPETSH